MLDSNVAVARVTAVKVRGRSSGPACHIRLCEHLSCNGELWARWNSNWEVPLRGWDERRSLLSATDRTKAFDREKIRNDAIAFMGHVHTAQARSFRLAESLAKLHWVAAIRAERGHSPSTVP
jgi:hypothetical protein